MLVLGGDVVHRLDAEDTARGVGQEVEGEVDAVQLAAWNLHIARHAGADGHHDGVVTVTQVIPRDVLANFHVGAEAGAFGLHLLDTAVEQTLLKLEVRDAVTHQTTDGVVLLVDDDSVASAGELLCGGEAGRAGADDGDRLVGQTLRRQRLDVVQIPCLIDDGLLVKLDHGRRLVDAEHAGLLAQGRADAAGDFGEVVGHGQTVVGVFPLALTDQVVPLGNQVTQRASGHAERGATIHAAGRLRLGPRLQAGFGVNVEPVLDTLHNGAFSQLSAGTDLQESSRVAHVSALLP